PTQTSNSSLAFSRSKSTYSPHDLPSSPQPPTIPPCSNTFATTPNPRASNPTSPGFPSGPVPSSLWSCCPALSSWACQLSFCLLVSSPFYYSPCRSTGC